jgi:hypothetical protein
LYTGSIRSCDTRILERLGSTVVAVVTLKISDAPPIRSTASTAALSVRAEATLTAIVSPLTTMPVAVVAAPPLRL